MTTKQRWAPEWVGFGIALGIVATSCFWTAFASEQFVDVTIIPFSFAAFLLLMFLYASGLWLGWECGQFGIGLGAGLTVASLPCLIAVDCNILNWGTWSPLVLVAGPVLLSIGHRDLSSQREQTAPQSQDLSRSAADTVPSHHKPFEVEERLFPLPEFLEVLVKKGLNLLARSVPWLPREVSSLQRGGLMFWGLWVVNLVAILVWMLIVGMAGGSRIGLWCFLESLLWLVMLFRFGTPRVWLWTGLLLALLGRSLDLAGIDMGPYVAFFVPLTPILIVFGLTWMIRMKWAGVTTKDEFLAVQKRSREQAARNEVEVFERRVIRVLPWIPGSPFDRNAPLDEVLVPPGELARRLADQTAAVLASRPTVPQAGIVGGNPALPVPTQQPTQVGEEATGMSPTVPGSTTEVRPLETSRVSPAADSDAANKAHSFGMNDGEGGGNAVIGELLEEGPTRTVSLNGRLKHQLILRRKSTWDRLAQWCGLTREVLTGDAEFDTAVAVLSDNDDWASQLLADPDRRGAVRQLQRLDVDEIRLGPEGSVASWSQLPFGRGTKTQLPEITLRCLHCLATRDPGYPQPTPAAPIAPTGWWPRLSLGFRTWRRRSLRSGSQWLRRQSFVNLVVLGSVLTSLLRFPGIFWFQTYVWSFPYIPEKPLEFLMDLLVGWSVVGVGLWLWTRAHRNSQSHDQYLVWMKGAFVALIPCVMLETSILRTDTRPVPPGAERRFDNDPAKRHQFPPRGRL